MTSRRGPELDRRDDSVRPGLAGGTAAPDRGLSGRHQRAAPGAALEELLRVERELRGGWVRVRTRRSIADDSRITPRRSTRPSTTVAPTLPGPDAAVIQDRGPGCGRLRPALDPERPGPTVRDDRLGPPRPAP